MNTVHESAEHDHHASAVTLPSVPSVASIDTVSCAVDTLDNHYELYGVVNHLGGMYGGHYVAMAKCEQIVLPSSAGATSTPASPVVVREETEEDSDSVEDRSTNNRCAPQRTPVSFQDYVYAHGGGSIQPVTTKKWLKFDDEFVLEVANTNNPIEMSVCTGKTPFELLFVILIV